MAHYEVTMVSRTPQQKGAPVLDSVGQLAFNNLSYSNDRSSIGAVQTSVNLDTMTQEQKDRFRDLRRFPTELWVYRDGVIVASGTVTNYQIMGSSLVLYAHGLAYYMRYMFVTRDLAFTGVDQFEIARKLLAHWQEQDYGNYGLLMSGANSGVTRDRSYKASENPNVYEKLQDLSEVTDGFDFWMNPATRTLELFYPEMGSDRSQTVVFDRRNINATSVQVSVQEDDIASDAYGTGVSRDKEGKEKVFRSHKWSTSVRQTFGKAGVAEAFDGVTSQKTLDGHTDRLLKSRTEQLFIPSPGLIPVGGVNIGDFGPGDLIQYSFDAGLGTQTVFRRVNTLMIQVSDKGRESMQVGLE